MRTENDKSKRAIVPNYVTESAYTETIPSREKVGDVLPSSRLAIVNTANGEVKWFDHGQKPIQDERKPDDTPADPPPTPTPKERAEREVALRMPVWSEDGKNAFVFVRSADNKDAWIMAFDPANLKGRILVTMHDDAWIRGFDHPQPAWLADNHTIYYTSEASGYMHLYEVPFEGGTPKQITSGNWEIDSIALSNDKKSFYVISSEESPFERHLYKQP